MTLMGSGDECVSQTSMLLMDGRWEGGGPRPGKEERLTVGSIRGERGR